MSSRVLSGILSVIGGRVGAMLLGVIITPLLVRILGSESYGDYAFLLSIFAFVITFVHAGISAGIRKFIAEDRDADGWRTNVFAFYARLGIALAVLSAVILAVFGRFGPAESLFGAGFSVYFLLLGVMVIADQLFYIPRYTLMGLSLEHKSEPLQVLKQVVFGVTGLSLAYIGYDVAGVLVGTAVASLLCGITAIWLLKDHIDLQSSFSSVPSEFPRINLLRFNVYNTVFILLTISLYNVDLLLLQPLVGSHETGLYKAALVVAEFIWLVPQAVQIVFIHSSSEMWSRNQFDEISSMASQATRYTFLFTLLLVMGIAALGSEFMSLYFGPEFVEGVTPLLFLLPGVLGFAVARPIFAIGQGKAELRTLIFATGSAAVLNLMLNLLLIPQFGMTGAAIATSIGYGSMLAMHGMAARKIGYFPFRDLRLGRICITAILTAPVIFGVARVLEGRILSLLIVPPLGFCTYTILALKSGSIESSEVLKVIETIPNPLRKWMISAIRSLE